MWSCGFEEASRIGAEDGALPSGVSEPVDVEFVDVKSEGGLPLPTDEGPSVDEEFVDVKSDGRLPFSSDEGPSVEEEFVDVKSEGGAPLPNDEVLSVEEEFVDVKSEAGPPFPPDGGVAPVKVEFVVLGSSESVLRSGAADPVGADPFSSVEVVFVISEIVAGESGAVRSESEMVVFDSAAMSFSAVAEPVGTAAMLV